MVKPEEKPLRARAALPLLGLALGTLTACGGTPEAQQEPDLSSPQAPIQPATAPAASQSLSTPGLVPLPSRKQVLAAVPPGRTNPFAPVAGGPGSPPPPPKTEPRLRPRPAPLSLPAEFRFTGVIGSGGVSEAIVEFGPFSGSVRSGDMGGRTTELLPPGWKVASVNVRREHLVLQKGSQRITARLADL